MKHYPGYKDGLNSRGLPSNKADNQKPTSERGKRRAARRAEGKTNAGHHVHEYKLWDPARMAVTKGEAYGDPGRAENERLFYCQVTNHNRGRCGGGRHTGCGATSKSGK